MSNTSIPEIESNADLNESFGEIFTQHERSRTRKSEGGGRGLEGTVITTSGDSVLVDIGFKSEGILPLEVFQRRGETIQPGDKLLVTVKGRNPDGYYELSLGRVERPKDWSSLEQAFADHATIVGTVTGVVKGGLNVDVGVRAFMPASRSGVRDAAEMEKLIGQEVRCRIIKLDVADEDVVVDRRVVAEDEERALKQRRYSEVKEGETVSGVVQSLMEYGAFVDIGGVDALLHVSDIAWSRVNKPGDVLSVGQQIEAKVLKVDPERHRISLGMKQLQPHPWDAVVGKYQVGERARGTVTRIAEFGAFVELEPGIEGLVHISEMSWSKRVKNASDVVKPGEMVEAVILAVNTGDRRISLGLKQALGDPWVDVPQQFPAGTVVEGAITSLTKFGAFVQLSEGVEGMIHISEISAEKRINHPQEVLKVGQVVRAQVLEIDRLKRQLRLSVKQLVPSSLDEYIAEHKEGDVVSGRVSNVSGGIGRVELGEGVQGTCRMDSDRPAEKEAQTETKADLSSLTSMLNARWKGGASGAASKSGGVSAGEIRTFKISKLDLAAKKIELEFA